MKKCILLVASVLFSMLLSLCAFAKPVDEMSVQAPLNEMFAQAPGEAGVLAIFAGCNKQARPTYTTNIDNLDTIWILFTNGEFSQFVVMDGIYQLFSCGTFAFDEEGRIKPEDSADYNNIYIFRTGKYMEGAGFGPYHTVHQYILNGSEYNKLWDARNPRDLKDDRRHGFTLPSAVTQSPGSEWRPGAAAY